MFGMKKKRQVQQSWMGSTIEFIFLLTLVFLIRTFIFGLYQVPTGSMETTMLVGERFLADKFSYWVRDPRVGEVIAFNAPGFKYSANPAVKLFERFAWGPSNWTKRIIAGPGDHVRGVVEAGKPVVYVNGKKIDEPYLNHFPLIHTFLEDPARLNAQIDRDLQERGISLSTYNDVVHYYREQRLHERSEWRSYDAAYPYDQQPFYLLHSDWIIRDEHGKPQMRLAGEPTYAHDKKMRGEPNREWNGSDEFNVQLADDEFWGMGDNRHGSADCRVFGPIKRDWIHGRIVFRIWSIDSRYSWWILDLLRHPVDFWHRVRWSRFLQVIK